MPHLDSETLKKIHTTPNIYKLYTSVKDDNRKQVPRNPVLYLLLTAHQRTGWLYTSFLGHHALTASLTLLNTKSCFLLCSPWQALLLLQSTGIPIYSCQHFRLQKPKCQGIFKSREKFLSSYNVFYIFPPSSLCFCILKGCFPSLSKDFSLLKLPIPFKIPFTAPKKYKQDFFLICRLVTPSIRSLPLKKGIIFF